MFNSSDISCGVVQLHSFDQHTTPEKFLFDSLDDNFGGEFAFAIFSDVLKPKRKLSGTKFAKYIKDSGLGTVVETKIKINPNSGNKIRVWVWEVDRAKLDAWYEARSTDKDEDGDYWGNYK